MNILFIEDDEDLRVSGILQLEMRGHKVYPTYNLTESRAILSDESIQIDLIISDHRLPDGLGIQFVIEIREQFPDFQAAIVSGCLNNRDIEILEKHKIPYFRKPLLYARVIDEMRKKPSADTPVYVPPESESAPVEEAPKKKRFGFWSKV
jgi:two-component system response regulator PilR (NtrC family)